MPPIPSPAKQPTPHKNIRRANFALSPLGARLEDMVQVEEEGNGWRCDIVFDFDRSAVSLREEIFFICV
jgi:hypothetical protein